MKARLFQSRHLTTARAGAPAFTLVEVMFAVITLGIGLIMLAAMFPIAINQRKLTSEETNAAAIATQAMGIMNQFATDANMPVTTPAADYYSSGGLNYPFPGTVRSLRDPQTSGNVGSAIFTSVRGSVVLPADRRLAWICLYRRDGLPGVTATQSRTAQVILIAVQSRNTSTFTANDYMNPTAAAPNGIVNLQARPVKVVIDKVLDPTAYTAQITASAAADFTPAAVQGAYVVIADDKVSDGTNNGRSNAHIYKLGALRTDTGFPANTYDLVPGNDFYPEAATATLGAINNIGTGTPADAFIVGKSLTDSSPAAPALTFDGPAMDIAVYTGFVAIH